LAVINPKITFIIPLFNHVEHSKVMLDSLLGSVPTDLDFEAIVVDDGSNDGTRAWLSQLTDRRIRPIFNDANMGYAKSNNRAAEVAKGSILGLLNNDLVLLQGWLEPMLEALCSPSANAGIVGNIQFRMDGDIVDHAGIAVNHLSKVEHIRALPRAGPSLVRVFAVTGACCLVSKRDFIAVGGFDERYVNGGEDVDLCLKLRMHRKYAYVATESQVRHHVSLTRSVTAENQERNERNSRLLFDKWRAVIQWETQSAWMQLLASSTDDGSRQVISDFSLTDAFGTAPHAVSGILAKSVCHREDMRWHEILDAETPIVGQLPAMSVQGFHWDRANRYGGSHLAVRYPWIDGCARLVLPKGCPTRNLFVEGKIIARNGADGSFLNGIAITLQINGVQQKSWANLAVGGFSLAMERPASIPQRHTLVTVVVASASDSGRLVPCRRDEAFKAVRFCAVIADDRRLLDLGRCEA
jgi:GT2 family glycosyltransferase